MMDNAILDVAARAAKAAAGTADIFLLREVMNWSDCKRKKSSVADYQAVAIDGLCKVDSVLCKARIAFPPAVADAIEAANAKAGVMPLTMGAITVPTAHEAAMLSAEAVLFDAAIPSDVAEIFSRLQAKESTADVWRGVTAWKISAKARREFWSAINRQWREDTFDRQQLQVLIDQEYRRTAGKWRRMKKCEAEKRFERDLRTLKSDGVVIDEPSAKPQSRHCLVLAAAIERLENAR